MRPRLPQKSGAIGASQCDAETGRVFFGDPDYALAKANGVPGNE